MDRMQSLLETVKNNKLGDNSNPAIISAEINKLRDNTKTERTFSSIITYKRRRAPAPPHMSEDIVLEILVRLPVEDLVRFQTVCKAWYAIITDPRFISAHLQRSASKNNKCFLIVPHTLNSRIEEETWPSTFSNNVHFYRWPSTFSNNVHFYRWQEDDDTARLLLAKDFHRDFRSVYPMLQRDGLVLFPTDTKIYVINPAIRDILVLPNNGQRDSLLPAYNYPQTVGFGLDPSTKRYKVARLFYRAVNLREQSYSMGMEVFTICGGDNDSSWRETLQDPPYPVHGFQASAYFRGSLFWIIGRTRKQSAKGLLGFSLEDEAFSLIPQPASASDGEDHVIVQGDKLFYAQCQSSQHLVIWMFCDNGPSQWIKLHSVNVLEPFNLLSSTLLHDGLYFHVDSKLFCCDIESGDVKLEACMDGLRYERKMDGAFEDCSCLNLHTFHWMPMPYTESLVPVTRAICDKATY